MIKNHFRSLINLARTNGLRINSADCIVGVLYGDSTSLSAHYQRINEDYTVIVGKDFWHRLTGDPDFYDDLISSFVEVAAEMDSSELLQNTVRLLAMSFEKDQAED